MDTFAWLTNALVIASALGVLALLWRPSNRGSRHWRATVTPLASIIGSGFLVVAPLLAYTVGNWAPLAMLGIVTLAYAVGAAVRYNIEHVEEISDKKDSDGLFESLHKWLERAAKLALAFAYVIAITFYLELLAAFVLRLFGVQEMFWQKSIATGLVAFIGVFGFWHGLLRLELLEKYSVDAKLAIIAGFLIGLVVVNVSRLTTGSWVLAEFDIAWSTDTIRKLFGMFLIVQGFETSRYMGNIYASSERIATMRHAQLLAAAIYVLFIALSATLFGDFSSISETGIIVLAERVAVIVPFMLVIGAVMAQFSAAVADTLASGGLIENATRGAVNHRYVYLAVMLLVGVLLWTSHILEIIAYASRAFAAYYAIQCAAAALHSSTSKGAERSFWRAFFFSILSIAMILTAVFGIPAESVEN